MIGVALAGWLLDQHRHDRLGDALRLEAGQLSCPDGLTEAINSDDATCASDVLAPEVGRSRLDGNSG